jgi:hypothetical protein
MAGWDDLLFGNLPQRYSQPAAPGAQLPVLTDDGSQWPTQAPAAAQGAPPAPSGQDSGYWWPKLLQGLWNTAKSGATLPGDVATGKASMADPATQARVGDMTTLATAGSAAVPGDAAELRAGGKLFNYSDLSKVPDVPQFDLQRYTPPRGVSQRVQDIIGNPDVRSQMLDTIKGGQEMGGANWYNADPLRQSFIDELGAQGDPRFKQYMDLVAATSPRSEVGTNVRNASYYYNRLVNGEPMPDVGTPNPQPYGHLAQRQHQANALEATSPEGWDVLAHPKPPSFGQNLMGNQQPVAVDAHAFKLPAMLAQDPRFLETGYQASKGAPKQNIQQMVLSGQMSMEDALKTPAYWQAQPNANEYGALEQYYKGLAQQQGLTPAQGQASAWIKGGQLTGLASDESKPFIGFVEDRANKTADARGISPQEALSQFIRGKKPLLGLGSAALAASPLMQQYQQSRGANAPSA